MQHGGQVNRHLGWVRLFFFFFSSVALVVARWEHMTPSVLAAGLSRHALCRAECAVAPSAVTAPHHSEKFRRIYRAVCRKTQSIIVFWAEKLVWIFFRRGTISPSEWEVKAVEKKKEKLGLPSVSHRFSMCVSVNWLHTHTHLHTQGATLFTGPLAGRTAPNHRHNPGPHCYAIPALKRLYAVPVRLAQHYHTIAHALRHVWLRSHTHECSPAAGGRKRKKKTTTHDRFNRSCCQRPAHRTAGVPGFVCSHRAANSLLPGQSEEQCKPDVFRFGVVSQHRGAFLFCTRCKARHSADVAFGKHLTLRLEVTSVAVSVDVSVFLRGGCCNKGTEMGKIDDGATFGKILFRLILKIVTRSTVVRPMDGIEMIRLN